MTKKKYGSYEPNMTLKLFSINSSQWELGQLNYETLLIQVEKESKVQFNYET